MYFILNFASLGNFIREADMAILQKKNIIGLIVSSLPLLACGNYGGYNHTNYQNDTSIYQFEAADRARQNPSALYAYENSMRGGLFAAYPTYWRLYADLAFLDVNTVIHFVQQYPNTALAEKLAADFAEKKAEQGDYYAVQKIAPYVQNADDSEACAIGLGFNQSNEYQKTLQLKDTVWLDTTWRRNPIALCQTLATQMTYNRGISDIDKKQRLVRMMRIDNRRLGNRPKGADNTKADIVLLANQIFIPITHAQLSQISANPNAFFGQFHQMPASTANAYLYLYAISQLALQSYTQAISQLEYDLRLDAQGQKIPQDIRRYAYLAIAVKRNNMLTDDGFDKRALDWFYKSLGENLNTEEAESFARIAIYYSDWQGVQHAINAMSAENKNSRMWQYWHARAKEAQGDKRAAHSTYRTLAHELDYYGLLAKDRLGQSLNAHDIGGLHAPHAHTAQVMADPYFARAILLMQNNAKTEYINREWNWAVKQARDKNNNNLIIQAALMMQGLGNYPRSIYAMENSQAKNAAISHPTPYKDMLIQHSYAVGIDPAWAYGIIRQESRFQTAAQSGANAQGLMQIVPGTARLIARNLGESVGNMNNPNTNIRYGTWYLADMARKSGGQLSVATASYNAGPNAAKAWLPKHGSIAADQFVEAIPYSETRDYVKKVMTNATIYGVVLHNPIPISQRMGVVQYVY